MRQEDHDNEMVPDRSTDAFNRLLGPLGMIEMAALRSRMAYLV